MTAEQSLSTPDARASSITSLPFAFPKPSSGISEQRPVGVAQGATLALQHAGEVDRDWLLALYASTRADELAIVPWTDAQKNAFLAQQFLLQHHHFVTHYPSASFDIVRANGQAVGRFYLDRTASWCIVDIALLPAWRSRGIGRFLIAETLRHANAKGADVELHVTAHNGRALSLYERLGFVVTSMDDMHYAMHHPYRTGDS